MKKLTIIICCILLVFMYGCGRKTGEYYTQSQRFQIVSGHNLDAPYDEAIIVDNETGVLYLTMHSMYNFGITPLLNADGTPMLIKDRTGG